VFELCQLYLQLTFVSPGALGEDVENHTCTIEHPALEFMLNVSFLTRTQRMIEQYDIGFTGGYGVTDFFQLSLTNEKSRAGLLAGTGNNTRRLNAGGRYQFPKLAGVFRTVMGSEIDVDEYRALTDIRTFKQLASTPEQ